MLIFLCQLGMQSLTNPEKVDLSKLLKENRNGTNPEIQISNIYHIVQFSMHETGSGTNNGSSVRVPSMSRVTIFKLKIIVLLYFLFLQISPSNTSAQILSELIDHSSDFFMTKRSILF